MALLLVFQLPPESRTVGMMRGGEEYIGWDFNRHLLTAQVDLLNGLFYAFTQSKTKKKLPSPKAIPVPGAEERRKESNPFAQQLALQFEKLRK